MISSGIYNSIPLLVCAQSLGSVGPFLIIFGDAMLTLSGRCTARVIIKVNAENSG